MKLEFTVHALAVMAERRLLPEWVERVLRQPKWQEPDPNRPSVSLAFGPVPERDDRILRVAYVVDNGATRVLTAFLDRTRRHGPRGTKS